MMKPILSITFNREYLHQKQLWIYENKKNYHLKEKTLLNNLTLALKHIFQCKPQPAIKWFDPHILLRNLQLIFEIFLKWTI